MTKDFYGSPLLCTLGVVGKIFLSGEDDPLAGRRGLYPRGGRRRSEGELSPLTSEKR